MTVKTQMNCLDVCRQLSGDCFTTDSAIKDHLASCQSCSAYAQQQIKLSDSLKQAVNITVPEGLVSRILLQQSLNEEKHDKQEKQISIRRYRVYAIAASVVLSVSVFYRLVLFSPPLLLEQVALNHVKDELHHLLDKKDIQLAKLNNLLQPYNMKLKSSLGVINYAGSCLIRQNKGVHIVVETNTGPVTILLMPGEQLENRQIVDDVLFSGSVVPIKKGSFAIIGKQSDSLNELEQRLKSSITYI